MLSNQLETFLAVVQAGSFKKASEELMISTVSVMNHINQLERRTGIRLFKRSSRGASLTVAGRSFYEDALIVQKLSIRAIEKANEIEVNAKRAIRIATSLMRPHKYLIELWNKRDYTSESFQIHLITYNDSYKGMQDILENIGKTIDCYVGPCDGIEWLETRDAFLFSVCKCCIAFPERHPLAKKQRLTWADLAGESLILLKQGISPTLDRLREDIIVNHPEIRIIDYPYHYDANIFNACENRGCLMETLDIWSNIHPSLVTKPMDWEYAIPYGIVYSKNPSPEMAAFVGQLRKIYEHNSADRELCLGAGEPY